MAIEMTEEWKTAINNAFGDGYPVVWASAGNDGQPVLNFFGTTQAYTDSQIGLWMRTPDRGLLRRIEENPQVAMMYRNAETRLAMQIHGEARRVDDQKVKDHVWEHAHPREQESDPDRLGTAVIVDVTRIIIRGEVVQSRD